MAYEKGANRKTMVVMGWNPAAKFSASTLLIPAKGTVTAKSARVCMYDGSEGLKLKAVDATAHNVLAWRKAAGEAARHLFWVTNGVDLPGNEHVRDLLNTRPVDAFKIDAGMMIYSRDIYVPAAPGGSPQLCVITAVPSVVTGEGSCELGQLIWADAGAFDTAGDDGYCVALDAFIPTRIVEKKLTGEGRFVKFLI